MCIQKPQKKNKMEKLLKLAIKTEGDNRIIL